MTSALFFLRSKILDWEVAQQLRVLAVLRDELNLVLSTHFR